VADNFVEIAGKAGKTVLKEAVKHQTRTTVIALVPRTSPKVADATANLVGVGFDVIYELSVSPEIKTGTAVQLGTKVVAAVAGLSDDEKMQCFGALLVLGGEAYELSKWGSATAAIELGSGGLATPAALLTLAMAARSAANTASALVKVNQQCGPVVARGYSQLKGEWGRLAGQLEGNVTRAVMSQGAGLR
jgi:hypothetical protein